MCRGPAEINKRSIPDETSYETAESRDGRRYTPLIDPNYGAEIFRIERGRQRGGAHQVAEHNADLTSLCGRFERVEVNRPILRISLARLVERIRGTHRRDRF